MIKKIPFTGLIIALCYFITAIPAMAQQKLIGHVFNDQTKAPIEGANITYGQGQGTITDAKGHFYIPCRTPVHLTVSYIGYYTFNKTIKHCQSLLEVSLVPRTYSLNKSTISANQDIREAVSMGELSRAELEQQSGLRLRKVLNTIPGVQMQTRSPFGGQRITIRGYYPNVGKSANFNGLGYQLYLNNIPVTDATGTTIMDDIDFSTLGRVNITKGPSPLYGNEIAGMVNLHSQRPARSGTSLSEQLIGGSYGLFRNNTALSTKNDNMNLRLNYGRQSYDGFRPHSASKKDYISLNGHFNVSSKETISAYFAYNHSNEQLAGTIDSAAFVQHRAVANPDYVNNDGGVIIKGFRVGVTSSHTFNGHLGNKTTVFATGHTLDQNFAHGFTYYNTQNYGARTNFTYQQQTPSVGISGQLGGFMQRSNQSQDGIFILPKFHAPFTPSTPIASRTNDQNFAFNYNVFTKWEFELPYHFQVMIGGILNFNKFGIRNLLKDGKLYSGSTTQTKTFDPTFNPSASILKSFGDQISVYASVRTGKTPPLLGDIIQGDGSVNNQLKLEQAVQYEIGSKGNLLEERLSYHLALFDLKITDRLTTQQVNDVSYTTNVGEQQNKGLEMALGYTLLQNPAQAISRLHLQLSYTYSHFRYNDFKEFGVDDAVTANYSGRTVAGVPPHRFLAGLNLQTQAGFYVHAKYKFMDRTPVTFDNKNYVKKYNLLSGRIGFKQNIGSRIGLDAFVGSNNITGSTYYNFLFVGQNKGALGDGYIAPAPYKSTIYGGATLNYNF